MQHLTGRIRRMSAKGLYQMMCQDYRLLAWSVETNNIRLAQTMVILIGVYCADEPIIAKAAREAQYVSENE